MHGTMIDHGLRNITNAPTRHTRKMRFEELEFFFSSSENNFNSSSALGCSNVLRFFIKYAMPIGVLLPKKSMLWVLKLATLH